MAVGFGAMLVLAYVGGLLDSAGLGDPRQSLQVAVIAGTLAWVGTLLFRSKHAR